MKIKIVLYTFVFFISTSFLFAQTASDAFSLYSKGNDCFNRGDFTTAITYYHNAIPFYERVYGNNHLYTADVYFFLGLSYSNNGNYDEAIYWLEKSYAIYNSENGNQESSFTALSYIGNAYFNCSNYDKALTYYQNALSLCKKNYGENYKETAKCYSNVGLMYEFKGEYKTALSYFQAALAIRQKLFGESNLETADSFHDIATEYYLLGHYQNSIDYYFKALKIREEILGSNSYESAYTLSAITTVYIECQLFDDALEISKVTEQIYTNLQLKQDSDEFAVLYNERGRIFYEKDDFRQSLYYWIKALEINQKLYGEKNINTATAYENVGIVYHAMGDYARAIANQKTALSIYKSILGNSNPSIALCYRSLGVIYRSTNDFDKALSYFNQALDIYKKTLGENHLYVARCYIDIGDIYRNKNDFQKALDFYQKCNNVLYDIFGYETTDVAKCYDRIAGIYDLIGEHDDARSLYLAAIDIYKNLCGEESASVSMEYNMLGWHFAGLNDVKNTVESFRKSYSGFQKSTNYSSIIACLSMILKDSQMYHYDSDISFIRDTISLAIDTVERARLDMNSMSSDLLKKSLPIYYLGVNFEAKHNNPEKAFEYSEMLRSRAFLEQIGLERAISLDGVTDTEREQIKKLTLQITDSRKEIEKQNNITKEERDYKKLADAEKRLSTAEKALTKLDESIGKRLPAYAGLKNPKTSKLNDVQKWCGKNRAVMEYVLYEGDDKYQNGFAYCIVVTKDKISVVPLDSSYDYNFAISNLRDAITHRPIKSEVTFEKPRNELYKKLIQPILPYIKDVKDLIIVPDGNMSFLPFDLLRENSDSEDFGKKYAIGISPSVSVSIIANKIKSNSDDALLFGGAWYDKSLSEEEHIRTLNGDGKRGKDRCLAAVDTKTKLSKNDLQNVLINEGSSQYFEQKKLNWCDLPGTIVELEKLQKATFKKAQIETQKCATEAALKKMSKTDLLSKYSIVHFACHGYFDSDFTEMSSVLFSEVSGKVEESTDDGYLTIDEAAALKLNAQMVCLSACQTGMGEVIRGEGMVGLSRAFMVAGSRNVGVTLWSVDDEATAEFMSRMYKKVKSGMSFSEAYRKVKNEFRNSDEYSHPFYWAAFVIYE